jgi:hypothetical protein
MRGRGWRDCSEALSLVAPHWQSAATQLRLSPAATLERAGFSRKWSRGRRERLTLGKRYSFSAFFPRHIYLLFCFLYPLLSANNNY